MAARPLTNNQLAAALAFFAGLVFVAVGWNGTRIVAGFVELLAEITPWPDPAMRVTAAILGLISPLSGALVIAGAILILYDRVRLGKLVVLLGTGAGIVSLVLFFVLLVRRPGRVLAHEGVVPALIGIVLSLAARIKAKAPEPGRSR